MYIVIETSSGSFLQTEYHIHNENQMEQFIIDKDCDEMVSAEDFSANYFSDALQSALNQTQQDKEYRVVHIWLH